MILSIVHSGACVPGVPDIQGVSGVPGLPSGPVYLCELLRSTGTNFCQTFILLFKFTDEKGPFLKYLPLISVFHKPVIPGGSFGKCS